jgi:hypothetical protein
LAVVPTDSEVFLSVFSAEPLDPASLGCLSFFVPDADEPFRLSVR